MMSLRCYPIFKFNLLNPNNIFSISLLSYSSKKSHHHLAFHTKSSNILSPTATATHHSPLSGLECVMMDYIFGNKKATQVAHSVWKRVVQKGDTVVDATCGNGHDTLAMLDMVSDGGRVYAMDIQQTALDNTISLLDGLHDPHKKEMVKLFATCHSKMEQVVPKGDTVRLVAFNLGYLPGGDKTVITKSETTLLGLEAATRIVAPGGLISIMVYVGHPGGMEEYEMVEGFGSGLDVDKWICCKLQMLNRPLAPILVLLCRR
ncbi:hypothetical protein OSB04_003772 [Centaurea solstitialis]|uniref:rRNA methylase n=1 Tax=Centaurea solstitialis TaxID=347529 RepID=A0AA38U5Z1_9ASTR|nr:hypothetical protein OSB04_003772 [Centaurea solstitialis]